MPKVIIVHLILLLLYIYNTSSESGNLQEYLSKSSDAAQFLGRYYSDGKNEYYDGIDVYLDGISEEKLKDIFKDYNNYFISWQQHLAKLTWGKEYNFKIRLNAD